MNMGVVGNGAAGVYADGFQFVGDFVAYRRRTGNVVVIVVAVW